MSLASDILSETDGKICKHCLGRKLSKTVEGSNNIERADKVCSELDIDLDDAECVICDNIFDKLDANRVEQIGKLVAGDDYGQIFVTDTNRDHLDQILSTSSQHYKIFHVNNGEIDV